ncbi:MAG: hypothetical protein ACYC7E_22330 [Armatimonadota bacterium]
MRHFSIALGLGAMLLMGFITGARAEGIAIAADPDSPDMKVEVNLRDADIVEVLTALFNSTNGKYTVEIGKGVVGRIARLQLPQTPFEEALNAVLGSEFSYTKQQQGNGIYRYRISGSAGTSPSPTTPLGGPALLAPPTASAGALGGSSGSTSSASSLFGSSSLGSGTSGGATSSDEKSVTKLIEVVNLDLESLCFELGGTPVYLYMQTSTGSSGGSSGNSGYGTNTGSRSSRSSRNSDTSGTTSRSSRTSRTSGNTGGFTL